jgi:hypothetical protein
LACIVPFCRRTRGQRKGEPPIRPGEEWICGPHYRLVDPALKALRRRAARAKRWRLAWMLWGKTKRQAIERAVGIS